MVGLRGYELGFGCLLGCLLEGLRKGVMDGMGRSNGVGVELGRNCVTWAAQFDSCGKAMQWWQGDAETRKNDGAEMPRRGMMAARPDCTMGGCELVAAVL